MAILNDVVWCSFNVRVRVWMGRFFNGIKTFFWMLFLSEKSLSTGGLVIRLVRNSNLKIYFYIKWNARVLTMQKFWKNHKLGNIFFVRPPLIFLLYKNKLQIWSRHPENSLYEDFFFWIIIIIFEFVTLKNAQIQFFFKQK